MVTGRSGEWDLDPQNKIGGRPGAELGPLGDGKVKLPHGDLDDLVTTNAPDRARGAGAGKQPATIPPKAPGVPDLQRQPQKPKPVTSKRPRPDEEPLLNTKIRRGDQADAGAKTSAAERNDTAAEQDDVVDQNDTAAKNKTAVDQNDAVNQNETAAERVDVVSQNDAATAQTGVAGPPNVAAPPNVTAPPNNVAPPRAPRRPRPVVPTAAANRPRREKKEPVRFK